jgi:hypothetical protein
MPLFEPVPNLHFASLTPVNTTPVHVGLPDTTATVIDCEMFDDMLT